MPDFCEGEVLGNRRSEVQELHPDTDPRWGDFIERHPRSSVFHTKPWLEALERTYGYEPIALTTCNPNEQLHNGVLFCRVRSALTGRRLVSLPFSDHCEPLIDNQEDLFRILSSLSERLKLERLKYVELRPVSVSDEGCNLFRSYYAYWLHQLDLTPSLDCLFKGFHKDSTQRKIRRAEREGLTYEEGASGELLDIFCRLHLMARERQGIPPQPKLWFKNLAACFGNALKIRVASKDQRPLAAILTIRHKQTLVYKYGASDARFNNLGGTHLLFWRSIQEAKRDALQVFDLGRSNLESAGLAMFKKRWGAKQTILCYSRYTASANSGDNYKPGGSDKQAKVVRRVLACVPRTMLYSLGRLLYKHMG